MITTGHPARAVFSLLKLGNFFDELCQYRVEFFAFYIEKQMPALVKLVELTICPDLPLIKAPQRISDT